MSLINKRKVGNLFNMLALFALASGVLMQIIADVRKVLGPSVNMSYQIISFSIFSLVIGALVTGEAGLKSGGVVIKSEHPIYYWLLVIILSGVGLAVLSEANK